MRDEVRGLLGFALSSDDRASGAPARLPRLNARVRVDAGGASVVAFCCVPALDRFDDGAAADVKGLLALCSCSSDSDSDARVRLDVRAGRLMLSSASGREGRAP